MPSAGMRLGRWIAAGAVLGCVFAVQMAAMSTVVYWTMPSIDADSATCIGWAGANPTIDLESVYVWGTPRWSTVPQILDRRLARGREGMPDSEVLNLAGIWSLYVTTKDSLGNESCPSNVITLGGIAGVGSPTPRRRPLPELFDVAGRRVRAPFIPGIYFRRAGDSLARVVIVR